jgi:SAM-dependent methyltransferase
MARSGYEVHGIDISAVAIEWARERFAADAVSGEFHHGSVCEMPFFDSASFDIVVDGSCLHCLIGDDRTRCLTEVRRILQPDGVFVVSSMCGLPKSEAAQARFDSRHGLLLDHGQPYRTLKPLSEIARELGQSGFDVQDNRLSVNAWWDHVTMICRIARGHLPSRKIENGSTSAQQPPEQQTAGD